MVTGWWFVGGYNTYGASTLPYWYLGVSENMVIISTDSVWRVGIPSDPMLQDMATNMRVWLLYSSRVAQYDLVSSSYMFDCVQRSDPLIWFVNIACILDGP
jgi:hypothetical protein